MDDLYSLMPPPTELDCYFEVWKLTDEVKKLKDANLIEHVSYLMSTFECTPYTDKVVSKYFQTSVLSREDRRFLEMTYVIMYGSVAIDIDGKIVTTIIKG